MATVGTLFDVIRALWSIAKGVSFGSVRVETLGSLTLSPSLTSGIPTTDLSSRVMIVTTALVLENFTSMKALHPKLLT